MNKDEDWTVIVDINENNNANADTYTNTNTDAVLLNNDNRKYEFNDWIGIGKLIVQVETFDNAHY